jgi:Cu/Ag efflux protein CusF
MSHFTSKTAALALGAVLACVGPIASDAAAAQGEGVVRGASVTAIGTVTAIDPAQRVVTIRNAKGIESTYNIDPSVQMLENVKVGDQVRLDYLVAVAATLRKGGDGIREKVEAEAEQQAPAGGKPGLAKGKRTTIVADVVSVDRARQTVRLKGPEGRVVDLKVQDKAKLADVKAGDQVVAVFYEAVAVGVKPAGGSAAAPKTK